MALRIRRQIMSMRLNRLFTGLMCLVLFSVLLGHSPTLWRGTPGLWFSSWDDSSPIEKDWNWLHKESKSGPAPPLREMVAKSVLLFNNSYLVGYVREKLLVFPDRSSGSTRTVSPPKKYSQLGQDKIVDKLLNHRTNGFFVEARAYDGEILSNTFFLEKERNWTGLLVEANPSLFRELKSKKRHAYLSNTCLSRTKYAVAENFTFADEVGGIKATEYKNRVTGSGMVQCIPLTTYLLALDTYRIDYFSLDVEGAEADVLRQIDFQRFRIDVVSVEYAGDGQSANAAAVRLAEIRQHRSQHGSLLRSHSTQPSRSDLHAQYHISLTHLPISFLLAVVSLKN